MRGVNNLMIVGNIGNEVELAHSKNGVPWLRLSVATSREDKDGVEQTDWHDVRVFGKEAEACARMLTKGSQVCVEGSVTYAKWTDADDKTQWRTRVMARRVTFLNKFGSRARMPPTLPSNAELAAAYG